MDFTIILVVWLFLSNALGYLGARRKIGHFNIFAISLFFSPLVGLIFLLSSPKIPDDDDHESKRLGLP